LVSPFRMCLHLSHEYYLFAIYIRVYSSLLHVRQFEALPYMLAVAL